MELVRLQIVVFDWSKLKPSEFIISTYINIYFLGSLNLHVQIFISNALGQLDSNVVEFDEDDAVWWLAKINMLSKLDFTLANHHHALSIIATRTRGGDPNQKSLRIFRRKSEAILYMFIINFEVFFAF